MKSGLMRKGSAQMCIIMRALPNLLRPPTMHCLLNSHPLVENWKFHLDRQINWRNVQTK